MEFKLTPEIKAQLGTARECMVVAEAEHLLAGTLLEARLEGEERLCFVKDLDVTLWEFRLGELLAGVYRPECQWIGRGDALRKEVRRLLDQEKIAENRLGIAASKQERELATAALGHVQAERQAKEAELAGHMMCKKSSWN